MGTTTLQFSDLKQPEVHGFLLAAVAPRPIALVSTIDNDGNVNLSPFSFFNVFSSNPPIMVFSPAKKGKDTLINAELNGEIVINIVNHAIVEQMSLSSTAYPRGTNEFVKSGLTPISSTNVQPPRVKEAPVAFEGRVERIISYGNDPGAGNLIFVKVELVHMQDDMLDQKGRLDTVKLDLVGRMGASWYTRANGNALFEIPKPLTTLGIGVDALPERARNSEVLTGNNLGRLGNAAQRPNEEAQKIIKASPDVKRILDEFEDDPSQCQNALHGLAQQYLMMDEVEKALAIVFL